MKSNLLFIVPRIALTASVATAVGERSGLFKDGAWGFTLAPQAVRPIFDVDRSKAGLVSARVGRDIAEAERFRLADLRCRNGVSRYLDVLFAQRSLFATQQELAQMKLAQQQSQVALYKALGGGWTE